MRKVLIILLCCTAVLLGGYASYRGYKVWKTNRMVRLARQYLVKRDPRNAILALKQALASNPNNIDAIRLMGRLAVINRDPSAALLWHSRVVELNPGSLEDRLALASVATAQGDYLTATNALNGASDASKNTFAFHNLAGTIAAGAGQLAEAEKHFLEAARLDPTNSLPQMSLAVVRLHRTNDQQALAQARFTLNELRANPDLHCPALRELMLDAARFNRTNDALSFSEELIQQTNSLFTDKLLRLQLLRAAGAPEFDSSLVAFQQEAATDLAKTCDLGLWEMTKTSPTNAMAWLLTLPDQTATNLAVARMVADCRLFTKDWTGLKTGIEQQDWGELEFMRHAYLARALRGLNLTDSAKTEWGQALKPVAGNKQGLIILLNLANAWNWPNEVEDLLSTILSQYPSETWAFKSLSELLFRQGRTRSLMALFNQQLKSKPADLETKNNLAMTALLLEAQELKPHALALEVYQKAPTNTSFASTYAFSLSVQDKDDQALKVLEALKPEDLERPSIAGYYGLVLQKTGDTAKAQKYLAIALNTNYLKNLLPEERAKFEKAKSGS
jgi:tetratricopeptide (TPR) repeat protein